MAWTPVAKGTTGIVQYDFEGNQNMYQLPLKTDDVVVILAESQGWYKGMIKGTTVKGIFPANYILVESDNEEDAFGGQEVYVPFAERNINY